MPKHMGRRLTLLLALWLAVFCTARADAPPQDTYLQIYFTFQEADRLEHSGQYASARAKYQDASDSLDTLKKNHPEWETSMVNFRIKYVRDKLTALADKQDTNAPKTSQSLSPSAPTPSSPAPSSVPPPTTMAAPLVSPSDTAAMQQRITALETELADTKKKLNDALTQAATLRQRLDAAERALAGVKGSNLEERVASLLDENNSLKSQLNDASQKVKDLQANGADSSVAQLRDQLKTVNQQVATLEAENQAFRSNTNELKAQLESALAKLDQADRQSAQLGATADSNRRENEVLRGILTRQLQEQARRDEAKRLATDEISNLHLQTKVLQQQIDVLSSPIVTLSPEERALLHITAPAPLPVPAATPATVAVPPPSTPSAAATPAPAAPAAPAAPSDTAAAATPPPSTSDKPRVPDEVRPLAKLASDYFNGGKYDDAADCYNKIIQKYPDSLYAWSNLGVVRFQQQKYPEAEKALQQAVKLNPNDAFSLSILGVVYYQESRYDDAIDTLTKATALNPEDARTWNYLGISYSQKGWQDAAEKALRKAVDIDPGLGDAQFNLAVIYATQKPPSRELARKHYQAALDQGIPKDAQLEKFFNTPEPAAASTPSPAASAPAAAPAAATTNAPAATAKP